MKEEAQRIWKKVYKYFLQGRDLLKHPKKRTNTSLRIVCKKEDKRKLVFEYHEGPWEGHRGVWVTFSKIKGKYWWLGMYKVVSHFVGMCESC